VKVLFVPEARDEFLEAIAYFEEARAGFGERFKTETERALLWAESHHDLYRLRLGGYRRINMRIFPYHIPFIIRDSDFWVLAIAHSARAPQYWIERKHSLG
jgi:hypothetical protein